MAILAAAGEQLIADDDRCEIHATGPFCVSRGEGLLPRPHCLRKRAALLPLGAHGLGIVGPGLGPALHVLHDEVREHVQVVGASLRAGI